MQAFFGVTHEVLAVEVLADDFPFENVGFGVVDAGGDAVAVGHEGAQHVLCFFLRRAAHVLILAFQCIKY